MSTQIETADALFIADVDDDELLRIASEQSRIVITRDRHIPKRRLVAGGAVEALLLNTDDFREQLREVVGRLDLDFQLGFSRCLVCNTCLRGVAKHAVSGRVPPYIFRTQEQFKECPRCVKLYWRGTHWSGMRKTMAPFMRGA